MTIYKKYRLENNLTQKEMAKKLNININTYTNYENGRRGMPYNLLADFLLLRGYAEDIKLAKILKGIDGDEVE